MPYGQYDYYSKQSQKEINHDRSIEKISNPEKITKCPIKRVDHLSRG